MSTTRRALPIASPPQQPATIIRMRDVVMCFVSLGLWILVIPSFVHLRDRKVQSHRIDPLSAFRPDGIKSSR